jgi:O-antigen/teichoic acid export membrane protein
MDRSAAKELLTFGGWITVSNIVGPLMVYFDRFVIGAVLSMTAVAYYTVPYEVITRLWIIPEAVTGVLFPALATSLVADPRRASIIFVNAARVLLVTMFVPAALAMLYAPEAHFLWLGHDFAQQSAGVLRWLALGVFVNSIARLPYAALQGAGRPDLTAKLHLVELPFYVALLIVLMHHFGIAGAAAAWTLRIVVDTVALFVIGIRQDGTLSKAQWQTLMITIGASGILATLALPSDEWLKAALAALITICGGAIAWHQIAAVRIGDRDMMKAIGKT